MKKTDIQKLMNAVSFTAALGTIGGLIYPEKIISVPSAAIGGAGVGLSFHLYSLVPYFVVILIFTMLVRMRTVKKLMS